MCCFSRMGTPPCQLATPILGKNMALRKLGRRGGFAGPVGGVDWPCISAPDAAMIRAFYLQARARAGRAAMGIPEER